MAYRTIKTFTTALGGYSYRVTSNGEKVNLQRRAAGTSTFRTFHSMTAAEWEEAAERYGIYDPYHGDNPATLEHIAHA